MSRPSRRVRQRLARKFTVSSEAAIASEQARKERQAYGRLAALFAGGDYLSNGRRTVSVAKMLGTNSALSVENISQNSHNAIGLFDGQIRVMANRGLSGKRRKRSAIERLLLAAALEATFSITHVEGEEKHAWITDTGFKVIRSFDCEAVLLGADRSRSIRAQNSGSGKPKRKLKPKPWYHSKDRPEPDFRLIQKNAKGKVFQEIGAPGGRILRERTPKK